MINKIQSIVITLAMGVVLLWAAKAQATPSSQIWIPSPDTQTMGTVHLGVDNYTTIGKKSDDGGWQSPTVIGLTAGVFDSNIVGFEIGADLKEQSDYPLYYNAKVVLKEDSFSQYFPAVAFGLYDYGAESDKNGFNITYILLAKTLPALGRLSIGYYVGDSDLLVDNTGEEENDGFLASYDRTLAEIDDRLWLAVDYMGGDNAYGALSFGLSWRFSPQVSTLLGFNAYNDKEAAGEDTFTIQFDIDF